MARLEEKVIIITGAAQGMGESHARRFIAEEWAAVVAKTEETFGPVDVLVNNTGITMANLY